MEVDGTPLGKGQNPASVRKDLSSKKPVAERVCFAFPVAKSNGKIAWHDLTVPPTVQVRCACSYDVMKRTCLSALRAKWG